MASITVFVDVPHPVADVWAELSVLEQHAEWMSDAERIDFETDQRAGVGTTMNVRTRVGPFVTNDVIVVDDWVEESRIAVTHRGLVTGTGAFTLESRGGGTRFTWSEDLTFPWWLGGPVTGAISVPLFRWIWRRNLARFAESLG